MIWTTTPWTIPANQALNVHPEIVYALVDTPRGLLILAEERVEECLERYGLEGTVVATTPGEKLANLRFHHPLASAHPGYERMSPVYLGDYVTTESGTGIVHSSPAYGVEDFISCKAHGMADRRHPQPGAWATAATSNRCRCSAACPSGRRIRRSSTRCASAGALLRTEKYTHSYMHCWRHKTPIIYRATSQWFVGMDVKPNDSATRRCAKPRSKASRTTAFYPAWGKQRLHGMIANRPDWTLSRQRQWGVPMAVLRAQGNRRAASAHAGTARRSRASASSRAASKPGRRSTRANCSATTPTCTRRTATRSTSGSTPARRTGTCCAARTRTQLQFPADLYLEGSDQHRGWFHSSLLTASMLDGRPPYNALLTHGFTVDGEGRKMTQVARQRHRAARSGEPAGRRDHPPVDRLDRLLGRTGDLRRDPEARDGSAIAASATRCASCSRTCRTSTSRKDARAGRRDWLEIDRYAIARAAQLQADILAHYEKYEFHPVVAKLQTFCSEDLGGFYLDVLKDRLYTTAPDSRARRSAQTALYHIAHGLLR